MPWPTIEGETLAPATMPQLEVLLRGVFDKRRFLDLIRHFIVFDDDGTSLINLSSEGQLLMGIREFGEWKYYAVERFRGILNLSVVGADKTCSPIPIWAKQRIREAWNVREPQEPAETPEV